MYFVHSFKCHLPPQDIKLVLNLLNYESSEHFRNPIYSFTHKRSVDFIDSGLAVISSEVMLGVQ